MKPGNAPPKCPRATDDTSGPRRCRFTSCPLHLHRAGESDRPANGARRELARELPDTCAVDLSERAGASGSHVRQGTAAMSLREIATVLGSDKMAIQKTLRRALEKVRLRVILDGR